ncbi:hypothetical protein K450DRAFT_256428 [Umbelopsis ramanniana AG]|uniref:Uncharacterized protein n=1 Tax=Umbelopsis ramanniana AG TaxID=1314678 RepID=A0AAD5E2Q8_UMBRA|nr:uncharacterized protein K450DRAFT_256428 [Umbelopsis ramanniana AG]KAI8576493.1 hypothetical protein K450DRAFT_256428 [Umbelopsis ramanniana AG]
MWLGCMFEVGRFVFEVASVTSVCKVYGVDTKVSYKVFFMWIFLSIMAGFLLVSLLYLHIFLENPIIYHKRYYCYKVFVQTTLYNMIATVFMYLCWLWHIGFLSDVYEICNCKVAI